MSATPEQITGHYVEVDGTRAYFERCGEGIPFICIHTAGTDGREFRHNLPYLASRGFAVHAPDLPGHGKSFPLGWKPIDDLHVFAEWVMAFAATLGLDRPVVMGCSIGGDIAVDLAVHHSAELRASIALEGAAYTPTYGDSALLMEPHAACWESIVETGSSSSIRADATPDQVQEIMWLHKSGAHRVQASDLVGWANHDVRDGLSRVTVPLLVGWGTGDYYVPRELAEQTVAAVPSASFAELDGLGHYPMWENPELVHEKVVAFLAAHDLLPHA